MIYPIIKISLILHLDKDNKLKYWEKFDSFINKCWLGIKLGDERCKTL